MHGVARRTLLNTLVQILAFLALAAMVAMTAVITKQVQARGRLAALVEVRSGDRANNVQLGAAADDLELMTIADPLAVEAEEYWGEEVAGSIDPDEGVHTLDSTHPPGTRFFNGRPVRPARTIQMLVTAYSPDEISCGKWADGITASLHSVHTNAHRLVASDPRVLPMGSMISVPGYDNNQVVPVLDKGGKIKGNRLDVLFPTHGAARQWGVRRISVTVWEYADGKPPENWRRIRDSRL